MTTDAHRPSPDAHGPHEGPVVLVLPDKDDPDVDGVHEHYIATMRSLNVPEEVIRQIEKPPARDR